PLGGLSGGFRTPLNVTFTVSPLLFKGAHVQVLIAVPVVLVLMTLFLRRSAVGVGIRASAANAERAMLLGIPVRRLSTVVWAVAAMLSALSAMLASPLIGSGSGFTSGPGLLLPALAIVIPNGLSPSQISLLGSVTLVYGIVAVSLVVLTGWAGQISLGQFAIAGLGATVTGDLVSKTGADLLFALIAGAAAGMLVAVLVGLPALRVRGLFLGVTTLAFAVPLSTFALNPATFSNLIPQQVERAVVLSRFDLHDERTLYYFCLVVLILALVCVTGVRRARPGRSMVAVRDNERAAAARGINVSRTKLAAFAVSGALAGLAGGLHAVVLDGVRAGSFTPAMGFEAFSMVVLGGAT